MPATNPLPTIADAYTGSQVQRDHDAAHNVREIVVTSPSAAVKLALLLTNDVDCHVDVSPEGKMSRVDLLNPTHAEYMLALDLSIYFTSGMLAGAEDIKAL